MKFRTAIISGLITLLFLSCQSIGDGFERPNIIIIYKDDQGYGDLSALNPNAKFQTPNVDKLANEGIIFTDGPSSDGV